MYIDVSVHSVGYYINIYRGPYSCRKLSDTYAGKLAGNNMDYILGLLINI